MKVSFDAIGQQYVTFYADQAAQEGKICKMGSNGTVTACQAGDDFLGVAAQVKAGAAAVVMGGYCELAYTGAAPAVGFGKLAAGAGGAVTVSDAGRSFLIVNVDTANKTVGLFL